MASATAMVNSPDVFQCFTSASLMGIWARAGTASARISNRLVFIICLGTTIHIAERAGRANGREAEFRWELGVTPPSNRLVCASGNESRLIEDESHRDTSVPFAVAQDVS